MKALALTTSFAAVLAAGAASPAALERETIGDWTVGGGGVWEVAIEKFGDWTIEPDRRGVTAMVRAKGRHGSLRLSCSHKAWEFELGTERTFALEGSRPDRVAPVIMTRDDERPSSVLRLKSMESDRYFVTAEHAGFRAAARRISWARRKLELRVDSVTYEFSMVGFERVWPKLKYWCSPRFAPSKSDLGLP